MATSKAAAIIRQLAGKDATIFNDKLQNGVRSFKVWGWRNEDYATAKNALEQAGFDVALVTTRQYSPRIAAYYMQTRLHVVV